MRWLRYAQTVRIRENVPLAPYTTFRIGGPARYFTEAATEADVLRAVQWAEEKATPLFVLGGGSNLLISDAGFAGLVLKLEIMGSESQGAGCFDVGAGEDWDRFVDQAIAAGCAGIECLAGIPGSVGGTPVQNVGAYGQEVSETISSVRALDRSSGDFLDLPKEACHFRYRESLFNKDQPGRYIVTRVRFQLEPGGKPRLRYADLQRRFAGREAPTLQEVAATVRSIRQEKGMLLVEGDADSRSAGSFFKNPIVGTERLAQIAEAAGSALTEVPRWDAGPGKAKLSAAWLVERAGFRKGFGAEVGSGEARLSSRHTLALTNRGAATFADVATLAQTIANGVEQKFLVRLEQEPVAVRQGGPAL